MSSKTKSNEYGHNVDPITLNRFILNTCEDHENKSRGIDLAFILNSVSVACKVIANAVTMSGIQSTHSLSGMLNSTGDDQKTLDVISNDVMVNAMRSSRTVTAMVSEEDEEAILLTVDPGAYKGEQKYVVVFDPLDGSSNIECNVSVGTIFGIYECLDSANPTVEDCLQNGNKMICAGYVLYSSSVIMVVSTGLDKGVHSFTIDPTFGEFVSNSDHPLTIPEDSKRIYSVNAGNSEVWDLPTAEFVRWTKRQKNRYSLRYIGSMVADVHRTLLYGGIFMYPADFFNREGKLRLIYECFPMAFLVEAAGGMASTGTQRILDLTPKSIHERSPIFLGCKRDVEKIEELYARIPNLYGMHFSPLESERSSSVMLSPSRKSRKRVYSTSDDQITIVNTDGSNTMVTTKTTTTVNKIEPNNHWAISVAKFFLTEDVQGSPDKFELSGTKGELFCDVAQMNDAKWVLASDSDGARGLVPSRLLAAMPSETDHEVAIAEFVGDADNNEIDFKRGDVAVNLRPCNDARWTHVRNATTGNSGIVPTVIFNKIASRKRVTGNELMKHSPATTTVTTVSDPVVGSDITGVQVVQQATSNVDDVVSTLKHTLVFDYNGEEDNFELSGVKGDLFSEVNTMQDVEWCTARDTSGRRGLVPTKALKVSVEQDSDVPLARSTFIGEPDHHEVSFTLGDKAVNLSRCSDPAWCFVRNARTGESGVAPSSLFFDTGVHVPSSPTPTHAPVSAREQETPVNTSFAKPASPSLKTSQTYVLTRDYSGDEDNFELCGRKGDTFRDVDVLADHQWARAKDADGNRGILPARLLRSMSDVTDSQVAITDFVGDASNYECDFKKGEVASNMRLCGDAAWVHVKNATTGCAGVVPTSVFKHETHKALQFHHEDSTTNPIFISAQ
eukprot:m.226760 g.226760  ORF g.226760 m.226760 type:complete len:899 (-) comp33501_c7_seq2:233-2929(-)